MKYSVQKICTGAILLFTGCASFTPVSLTVKGSAIPISASSNINREYAVIKHVQLEQRVTLLFFQRMFDQCNPDIQKMVEEKVIEQGGDAFINMSITGTAKAADILLPVGVGALAAALATPAALTIVVAPLFVDMRTYTIEGDIVRYVESPETMPLPQRKEIQRFDPETGKVIVPG